MDYLQHNVYGILVEDIIRVGNDVQLPKGLASKIYGLNKPASERLAYESPLSKLSVYVQPKSQNTNKCVIGISLSDISSNDAYDCIDLKLIDKFKDIRSDLVKKINEDCGLTCSVEDVALHNFGYVWKD
jgi:hypothetical protein